MNKNSHYDSCHVSFDNSEDRHVQVNSRSIRNSVPVNYSPSIQYFLNPSPVSYTFKRFSSRILSNSYTFQLMLGGAPLMTAKSKMRHPINQVPIKLTNVCHLSDLNPDYVLIPGNSCNYFSLREDSLKGKEILTVKHFPANADLHLPSRFDAKIQYKDFPISRFIAKAPKKSIKGYYYLDFHNKFALNSTKNAIFCINNDPQEKEYIIMRKIEKNATDIETIQEIPPILIFALTLSIYLSKSS